MQKFSVDSESKAYGECLEAFLFYLQFLRQ